MRTKLFALLGTIGVIALVLALVVGLYWIVDLAPILLFVGVVAVYVILSTQQQASAKRK